MKKYLSLILLSTMLITAITVFSSCGKNDGVLKYSKESDGYHVTGVKDTAATEIIIPEEIDGTPVTVVDSFAFKDCTNVKKITVPSSITTLSFCAFQNCTGLEELIFNAENCTVNSPFSKAGTASGGVALTIGKTVKTVPAGLFIVQSGAGGEDLAKPIIKSVTFEEGSVCETIGNSAFLNTDIAGVTLPDTVKRIDGSAFSGCLNMTSIILPESLESIGNYAFLSTPLTELNIPANVTDIGSDIVKAKNSGIGTGEVTIQSVTFADAEDWCSNITGDIIPANELSSYMLANGGNLKKKTN